VKTRTGFVSNSSSSSFVITTKEPLSKQHLLELFKVPVESPLYYFVEEMAEWFERYSEQVTVKHEHC
jgi:hypothetical protein